VDAGTRAPTVVLHSQNALPRRPDVSILVDDAIWPWRGERWAHLISDRSLAELHQFATGIGKKRVSFQGDHYDVRVDEREAALAAGAIPVTSREIVGALRDAGLRRRPSDPKIDWQFDIRSAVEGVSELQELLHEFEKSPGASSMVKAATSVTARAGLQAGRIEVTTLKGSRDVALILSAPESLWQQHPDVSDLDMHEAYVSTTGGIITVEMLTGPGTNR